MYWVEPTVFALLFLMDCVWVDKFIVGFKVDSPALVSSIETLSSLRVPNLDFSRATD
jgi:hypothetical protein